MAGHAPERPRHAGRCDWRSLGGSELLTAGRADGTPLRAWLAAEPEARLGKEVAARWGGDLPFLLKVLSVGKALSIQAHPDKVLAARLFREQPAVYKARRLRPSPA